MKLKNFSRNSLKPTLSEEEVASEPHQYWRSRRKFLSTILFTIFSLGIADPEIDAYARAIHGGVASGGGGATDLTTMTLLNTSGATQPIGGCTQLFGHPFIKGAIPTGTAPIFKTTSGGTVFPFSMSTKLAKWSDGSLKHCAFMLRLPITIAGNASLGITIASGGTIPSASSRALSDFAAGGLDLNVFVTGQDQLTGDWTSNLNQGVAVANADNYVYLDGDAGKMWRIRASFRQSGADHGQLEGYWFPLATNDASGNLGGVRYLCRIAQPWYNVVTPAPQYRSFSVCKTRNGTTQIRDLVAALPVAKTFTWTSGYLLNSPAHGFETGIGCKLSTTGTLPAGLDSTTLYMAYAGTANETAPGVDANHFSLRSSFDSVDGGGANITPTSAGTGTHTCTMYPMVAHITSIFTAETDGRYSYIQGGGSLATDTTILCQMNPTYWCQTKTLPPYAIGTYIPNSTSSYNYFPGTAGPVERNIGGTGERKDIGLFNDWQAAHLFRQTAVDERAVRVVGLIGGHLPVCFRDFTTKALPSINATNYAGMPNGNPGLRTGHGHATGWTTPSLSNYWFQGWAGLDTSHITPFNYYAYLLTGEPHNNDLIFEHAAIQPAQGYTGALSASVTGSVNTIGAVRNSTINGVARYGVFVSENLLRNSAWLRRALISTQICSDVAHENASYQTYFKKMLDDTNQGYLDYIAMLVAGANAYVTNNGMWSEQENSAGGINEMWAKGYCMHVTAFEWGLTESTKARDFANYLIKWPAHVCNTFGGWSVCGYQELARQGGTANNLYITSDSLYATQVGVNVGLGISWNSGTNLFTYAVATDPTNSTYLVANGDKYMWNFNINGPLAGGFTGLVPYYVVNKTGGGGVGTTFQLSATIGGAPVTITDTNSNSSMYIIPVVAPATGSACGVVGDSYVANVLAASQYIKALGGTVDATYLATMTAILTGTPGYAGAFVIDPKYAFASAYV